MSADVEMVLVNDNLKETALNLIKEFWLCHNNDTQELSETLEDYDNWNRAGHRFYLVKLDDEYIGFAHLGNRGAGIDWLEDLFILPKYQRQGLGSQVIKKLEDEVKQYSESLYIEAAARNLAALKLYRNLGYDCLNSITIRKDFEKDSFSIISEETISGMNFEIRKYKD